MAKGSKESPQIKQWVSYKKYCIDNIKHLNHFSTYIILLLCLRIFILDFGSNSIFVEKS